MKKRISLIRLHCNSFVTDHHTASKIKGGNGDTGGDPGSEPPTSPKTTTQ